MSFGKFWMWISDTGRFWFRIILFGLKQFICYPLVPIVQYCTLDFTPFFFSALSTNAFCSPFTLTLWMHFILLSIFWEDTVTHWSLACDPYINPEITISLLYHYWIILETFNIRHVLPFSDYVFFVYKVLFQWSLNLALCFRNAKRSQCFFHILDFCLFVRVQ